jgi:predicted dehydrogenase
MEKVRWGLLSTAHINRRLIPAIRDSSRGALIAIASRSESKAQQYAAEWAIPRAFGGYESMLTSGEIDAVYIGLPNHLHAAWTIRALEAGIHVLCEKPFALTMDEVDNMIQASRQNNRVLAEAFMYRHHPQTKMLGDWVHSGRLGEITIVRGVFHFALDDRDNIRMIPDYGGGSLWDVGVYPVSLAQYLMGGPPEWVTGAANQGETGVDMTFAGQLIYSGGRMAQITSSFRTPFHTHAEVIGTKGRLTLSRPFVGMEGEGRMTYTSEDGISETIPVPEKSLYLGEVEDMHAAILDGDPNYLTLEETRDHVRTILALYESADNREIVRLSGDTPRT